MKAVNTPRGYSAQALFEIKDSVRYFNWTLQNIKCDNVNNLKYMLSIIENLEKDLQESKAAVRSEIILQMAKDI